MLGCHPWGHAWQTAVRETCLSWSRGTFLSPAAWFLTSPWCSSGLRTLGTPISVGLQGSKAHSWREFSASLLLFKVRLPRTDFSAAVLSITPAMTLCSHKRMIHKPDTFGGVIFQFRKILPTAASSGSTWSLSQASGPYIHFMPTLLHVGYKDLGHLRLMYLFPGTSRAQFKTALPPAPIRIRQNQFHLGHLNVY